MGLISYFSPLSALYIVAIIMRLACCPADIENDVDIIELVLNKKKTVTCYIKGNSKGYINGGESGISIHISVHLYSITYILS